MNKSTTPKVKRGKSKLADNRVADIMMEQGMSAQELADIIETTPGHLSKIMSQQRRCLSLPLGLKIASALKTPVEKIFFLELKK